MGCFAIFKRAYGHFVSNLLCRVYNHIDKYDLDLAIRAAKGLPQARYYSEYLRSNGLMPVDVEGLLPKLNSSLRTSTPLSRRPSSRSSQFNHKRLEPSFSYKSKFLFWRIYDVFVKYSFEPNQSILVQIIKQNALSVHKAVLPAQDNANPCTMKDKIVKKHNPSTRQIAYREGTLPLKRAYSKLHS